jgi:hypothetical protein
MTSGDASVDLSLTMGETLYVASSSGASPTVAVLRLGETT